MNLSTKQKRLTDTENRFVVSKGEGVGGGEDWEFEISRCELIYRMATQQGSTV